MYTTTESNSVAPPGGYVGNFDYLLQHGAHVDNANAKGQMAHFGQHDVIHKTGSTVHMTRGTVVRGGPNHDRR